MLTQKQQIIINSIISNGIEILEVLPGNKSVFVRSIKCDHTYKINLYAYSRNPVTCGICERIKNATITKLTKKYIDKMEDLNIKLVSEYTNRNDVHEFECFTCAHKFGGIFKYKLSNTYPCPECAKINKNKSNIITTPTTKHVADMERLNIKLRSSFTLRGDVHSFKCLTCNYEFSGIFKFVLNLKYPCKMCRQKHIRSSTLDRNYPYRLQDIGIELIGDYEGAGVQHEMRCLVCDHIWSTVPGSKVNSRARNGIGRGGCPNCNNKIKYERLQRYRDELSYEYSKTATQWLFYRFRVQSATKKSLKLYNHIINPHGYPIGNAGIHGMYQTDHIMPIRWCFDNAVPSYICGHYENLQTLTWKENATKKSKLPDIIPEILQEYVNIS